MTSTLKIDTIEPEGATTTLTVGESGQNTVIAGAGIKANLVRDLKSQAIINTDSDAYARYMARKRKQKAQNDELREVIRDVNELKIEMKAIKEQLIELSNGR